MDVEDLNTCFLFCKYLFKIIRTTRCHSCSCLFAVYSFSEKHSMGSVTNITDKILTEKNIVLPLQFLTASSGISIFVVNSVLLVLILRESFSASRTNKDMYSVVMYTLFVCANDVLAGLALFIFGCIEVYEKISAQACVYTGCLSLALQLVSQGNIAGISILRYRTSKHVARTSQHHNSYEIKVLLFVNIAIGVLSFGAFIVKSPLREPPYRAYGFCSLTELITREAANSYSLFFFAGLCFTITADVFGLLTIRRLKTEISIAIQPNNTSRISYIDGSHISNFRPSMTSDTLCRLKKRQRKVTLTIFLIIFFFNLTVLPVMLTFILISSGVYINSLGRRISYVSAFLNSLINPFIIATRVEKIRLCLKNAFFNMVDRILSFIR